MSGDLHDIVARHGIGFNYQAGDAASLAGCLGAATPEGLAQFRVNAKRFFAASLELRVVQSDLEAWLGAHLRMHVG